MPYDAAIECPHCKPLLEKWGYSGRVVTEDSTVGGWGRVTKRVADGKALCEGCGGIWDGETWHYQCRECGCEEKPLTGLFVPTLCRSCEKKKADAEIATGRVCRMCHSPFSRCCC